MPVVIDMEYPGGQVVQVMVEHVGVGMKVELTEVGLKLELEEGGTVVVVARGIIASSSKAELPAMRHATTRMEAIPHRGWLEWRLAEII